MKRLLSISILILFLFVQCKKEENYSNTPKISFNNFEVKIDQDSELGNQTIGVISFTFVDGDGDIGSQHKDSTYYPLPEINDMFVYEYYKVNNEFVLNDTLEYWLPYFEKKTYRSYLKGAIDIKINHTILDEDTAYYEFYIRDRSYNESNLERTPVIIYEEQ